MAVTAMCTGIGTFEADNLPGGVLLAQALLERPDSARAPVCCVTRDLHIGLFQAVTLNYSPPQKGAY